jgi:acylphosphatase
MRLRVGRRADRCRSSLFHYAYWRILKRANVPERLRCAQMVSSSVRARILVSGRVQGVAYRAFTREAAIRHGLSGRVRNLRDGRVEVEVEGERQGIEALIGSLRVGPPMACVENLEVQWGSPKGQLTGFHVWFD